MTKISRFKGKSDAFIERILHPEEVKEFINQVEKEKYLATRWAIKEALFKADNKLLNFNEIHIIKEKREYKYKDFKISTSNEGDMLVAIVLKEK